MPLSLRAKTEAGLDGLQEEGVNSPVDNSEWAAQIVPVLKFTEAARICEDNKVTINQAVNMGKFPIPSIKVTQADHHQHLKVRTFAL